MDTHRDDLPLKQPWTEGLMVIPAHISLEKRVTPEGSRTRCPDGV